MGVIKCVGMPKTIDNDLSATDQTFGFDTAITIATECIDRLHSTAESHHRIMVVEVMGRHAGWIATAAGIAGGADYILIPEQEVSVEDVVKHLQHRHSQGKSFSIVVAAEGAKVKEMQELALKTDKKDDFGHVLLGGVADWLAKEIEKRMGAETRSVILGHIQRGGSPTAYDRILASRFGVKASDLVKEGKFGYMVALKGNQIVDVPLSEAVKELKTVDKGFFEVAKVFFG
jgi:6-phosphofructokinase 1